MGEKQIPVKKIDDNRWMIERQRFHAHQRNCVCLGSDAA